MPLTSLCPKCFSGPESAEFRCRTGGCAYFGRDQAQEDAPPEDGRYQCAGCGFPLGHRVCGVCGYILPRQEGGAVLPLLLAGSAGCGKSAYAAALIQSIKQNMSKVYECALHTPQGEDRSTGDSPLEEENQCPSEKYPEPLAYSVIFSGEKPVGNTCSPVFYDPGGDVFQSEGAVAGIPVLPHVKGILLFVDPLGLPGVREQLCLEDPLLPQQDPTAVLTRVIHTLRLSHGATDLRYGIGVPLAVCLTKLDRIAELLDRSSFIRHPTRHLREASFDSIDWKICDLEVQSLVESWGGGELLNQVRAHFSHHSFFGVGALGIQSKDSCILDNTSHRVLDPFLWMMWQHKMIRCT